ncbi:ABC transporter type 1, transmembrane domain-containing protein [Trametes elegans]|nr:ABC transporter type 1, transmembrane domain-containing protein [Trametes elegans]
MIANGFQTYLFATLGTEPAVKLRSLFCRAILRQDIKFFDKDENNTGQLTATLSGSPQKINGLAGNTSRVVVLKDDQNKHAHQTSAHLACEAAGAIHTIASLTREEDCYRLYSAYLDEPLRRSNRAAIYSNGIFALSQAMTFFVVALVFLYGSVLVADRERSTFAFFMGLKSITFSANQINAESPEGAVPEDVHGRILFERVHFCYPTRPGVRVLRDLSFTVEPGTYVAQ